MRSRPARALLALGLLTACSHQCGPLRTSRRAPEGPATRAALLGDGERVAGPVGPRGGSLALSVEGPSVEIPPGVAGSDGIAVLLRLDPGPGYPVSDGARTIGPLLLLTPPLDLVTSRAVVLSLPLAEIPAGHSAADLALAVEEPGDQLASATRWRLTPVEWKNGRAIASLSHIWGMRLQLLLRRAPGATEG